LIGLYEYTAQNVEPPEGLKQNSPDGGLGGAFHPKLVVTFAKCPFKISKNEFLFISKTMPSNRKV